MVNGQDRSFGRVPSPDARDGLYPMRAALGPTKARTGAVLWANKYPALDQGSEGTCVGHGWKHWLLTEPLTQAGPAEDPTALAIYDRCTQIDEFPGELDRQSGTSVRAGAKVMVELGLLAEYRHAQALADATDWLADKGPIVIGCDWYEGMMRGSADGYIRPTGTVRGGHCVCVQGVDFDRGRVIIRNSWGEAWGPLGNGTAYLALPDLDRLLFRQGGDALAGLEVALGPTPPIDVFQYPFQEFRSLEFARANGWLEPDFVNSKGELLYLAVFRCDRDGMRELRFGPLYEAVADGYVVSLVDDDPTLLVKVQRIQAKHRSDWNA